MWVARPGLAARLSGWDKGGGHPVRREAGHAGVARPHLVAAKVATGRVTATVINSPGSGPSDGHDSRHRDTS